MKHFYPKKSIGEQYIDALDGTQIGAKIAQSDVKDYTRYLACRTDQAKRRFFIDLIGDELFEKFERDNDTEHGEFMLNNYYIAWVSRYNYFR